MRPLPGETGTGIAQDGYRAGVELVRLADVQVLATGPQPVHAVMARCHPPASGAVIRLSDTADDPIGMQSEEFNVPDLLDISMRRSSAQIVLDIESDSFEFRNCHSGPEPPVTLQITVGLPPNNTDEIVSLPATIVSCPINTRNVPSRLL